MQSWIKHYYIFSWTISSKLIVIIILLEKCLLKIIYRYQKLIPIITKFIVLFIWHKEIRLIKLLIIIKLCLHFTLFHKRTTQCKQNLILVCAPFYVCSELNKYMQKLYWNKLWNWIFFHKINILIFVILIN